MPLNVSSNMCSLSGGQNCIIQPLVSVITPEKFTHKFYYSVFIFNILVILVILVILDHSLVSV